MDLLDMWGAGVAAVRGEAAVQSALDEHVSHRVDCILAIGKAACDMAVPALKRFPEADALIVTKHDHSAPMPRPVRIIEAGHPIPDETSLVGGAALTEAVEALGPDTHLLILVSGGASAVAESLPEGMTLAQWQSETQDMMAAGADIHAINTRRKEISQIKGGKLLSRFKGAHATTLAISDVEGDSLDVIGSGIGACPAQPGFSFDAHIVASNAVARAAVAASADAPIIANEEALYDDVTAVAPRLAQQIKDGPKGLYIFGGEPVVHLPDTPGRGGRNQALALLMAREVAGLDGIDILVAGTDGSDGPTGDAGGRVTGQTWGAGAADALARADAGTYLHNTGALVTTGPTGTNVMDLMIARKT